MKIKNLIKFAFYFFLAYILSLIFGDKNKDILTMVLPLVSIIIPFQIATYSLVVVIIDTEALKNIRSINPSALDELLLLFDEFSSDTRSIILLGILFFISTFIVKQNFNGLNMFMYQMARSCAFFSLLAIFAIVFESITVILSVCKGRIEIVKNSKKDS